MKANEYIGGLPKSNFSTYDAEARAEAIAMQENNDFWEVAE